MKKIRSSFRDPGAFVYSQNGNIYRRIYPDLYKDYKKMMSSGLYEHLVNKEYLVPHIQVETPTEKKPKHITIKPNKIPFISYPYEWCFSQLKDAAILTLNICIESIKFGLILKDASSYNIQFYNGKPIFIDTCSIQQYEEGSLWPAYQQFCMLLFMSKKNIDANLLLKIYIDGIPLEFTSSMMPIKSWISPFVLAHIHLHSKSKIKYSDNIQSHKNKIRRVSKNGILGLLHSLKKKIEKLKLGKHKTEWGDYYDSTNYTNNASKNKSIILTSMIRQCDPTTVIDIGSNNGLYSRIAAKIGASVISVDSDPLAVENNYLSVKNNKETQITPILQNIVNPSPGIGWSNNERSSLIDRCSFELVVSLALIHHLSISNNIPFDMIAKYFSKLGYFLIIEFVPKEDSQVEKLLLFRQDIFNNYNREGFEKSFSKYYTIVKKETITGSSRTLYLMSRLDK